MDDATLSRRMAAHRREIVLHCYRMLGVAPDAEDATQDAFLKAWQARASLEREGALRAWLYRIATNVCLDLLEKRGPRVLPHLAFPPADVGTPPRPFLEASIWVGPFPDAPTFASSAAADGAMAAPAPDALHERAERVTLAFVAALQHLPARQRAALLLRDVVELSADEAAEVLKTTTGAVEAALQRARATLRARGGEAPVPPAGADERELLGRYVSAWHARDPLAFVALLSEDASFVMPPTPVWFHGKDAVGRFVAARLAEHAWRLVPTAANGLPAFGLYRAQPDGGYVAHGIQLLEVTHGAGPSIATMHTFLVMNDARLFGIFGLPARLEAPLGSAGGDSPDEKKPGAV